MKQRVKHSQSVTLQNYIKTLGNYETIPIEQFDKMLEECRQKGVTHLCIEADVNDGVVDSIEISAEIKTFEEMQNRVGLEEHNRRFREERNKELVEKKERETLLKLKQKYE